MNRSKSESDTIQLYSDVVQNRNADVNKEINITKPQNNSKEQEFTLHTN